MTGVTIDVGGTFTDCLVMDAQGRLVLTPLEQARSILDETFGMWADRTDIPKSGIKYMDKIRHGHRLKDQKLSSRK